MSTKITPKVKNKVWQDYTKNSNSKNELKQMFLGTNPTSAYKKISLKLKKKLDNVKTSSSPSRKTLRPKIPKKSLSPFRKSKSLKRSPKQSPKRSNKLSPKRSTKRSPKRSPKRSIKQSPKRILRPSRTKLLSSKIIKVEN